MRIWRSHELGDPIDVLRLEEADDPEPGPGEVVIDTLAVGLKFPDVLTCRGEYQVPTKLPHTPGGEASGIVSAIGAGVDGLEIGTGVAVLGGGLAEKNVVGAGACYRYPTDVLSAAEAAAIPVNYCTTWFALHERAELQAGETVLITGAAGGTGTSCIQLTLAAGGIPIAVVGGEEKAALVRSLGVDLVVDHRQTPQWVDTVREMSGGGVDVAYDSVGGDAFHQVRRCMGWNGRLLVIGFVGGIPDAPMNHTLLKNYSILGVHWGASLMRDPDSVGRQLMSIFDLAGQGAVKPALHPPVAFDQAARAIQDIAERKVSGKAVVEVGQGCVLAGKLVVVAELLDTLTVALLGCRGRILRHLGDLMTDLRRDAQAHVVPHFTKGAAWNADDLIVMDRGEGCYIWDTDGNKYLDGLAGLFCTNLGHGRSDLAAVASKQMERMAFYPNWGFSHEPVTRAASMIAEDAPGDLDDVFFVSSGSEAVESALKFARNYHVARGDDARFKVISRDWSYHGTTLAALTVTGVPKFRKTFLPMMWDGVRHVRNTHGDTPDALDSAKAVEDLILAEGPETVAMVIAEPVQNGRGCVVPPDGYWQELRRICDKYGVLLCADEVICSFGRLGYFFGSERFDVVPDMITFAKGVTSAYLPLGGVVVRRPLVEQIWESDVGLYNHGSTFGGHPVSTAVAVANIQAMRDEDIMGHVRANEDYMRAGFEALVDSHNILREWRGTGYFYALELMADRANGIDLSDDDAAGLQGGVLARFLRDSGLLVRPDDRGATMLTFSPPLVADKAVIDDIHERADQVLSRTTAWLAGDR